jgi:hypothetical protein
LHGQLWMIIRVKDGFDVRLAQQIKLFRSILNLLNYSHSSLAAPSSLLLMRISPTDGASFATRSDLVSGTSIVAGINDVVKTG